MRPLYLLASVAFLASIAAVPLAQAQSGGVFQPPEEQRRLGLPDKAAPAPEVPVAPLPPKPRAAKAAPPASAPAAKAAAGAAPTGQWASDCEIVSGKKLCQATIRSAIGSQIALVLSIANSTDGLRMQMALPLGFAVQRDVEISVGDFKAAMKVSRCTAQGCLVEEKVSPDLIKALKIQKAGTVSVYTVDGKKIDIALPTEGADAVLAANLPR